MPRMLSLLLLALCASPAWATEAAIVEDFPEGETVIVVKNVGGIVTHRVVKASQRGGSPPTKPDVTPKPPGELAKWVDERADAIPAHKLKEETRQGLAAAYSGLAAKYRSGDVADLASLLAARKQLHDRLTGALGVADEWKEFDADLVQKLNEVDPEGRNVAETLDQVAAGLTAGQAIDPAVITAGIELVVALLAGDSAGISAAIGKIVVALLSSPGG